MKHNRRDQVKLYVNGEMGYEAARKWLTEIGVDHTQLGDREAVIEANKYRREFSDRKESEVTQLVIDLINKSKQPLPGMVERVAYQKESGQRPKPGREKK